MSRKAITYGIVTALVAIAFVGPGIANLVHVRHIVADMAHLGYPAYFSTILGTWKLLGAAVVVAPGLPRAKEWAYAGMIFDLTGELRQPHHAHRAESPAGCFRLEVNTMKPLVDPKIFGPWAIVTGSSSGIGAEIMGAMIGKKFARPVLALAAEASKLGSKPTKEGAR